MVIFLDSNLYTKPQKLILLLVAAIKPQSASLACEEGDELVTNELDLENLNKVLPAFKEGVEKSFSSEAVTIKDTTTTH